MGKKRKRAPEKRSIHPRNKYSDNPPDFTLLASLYPSFQPYVFYSREGKPKIDWKDFNATRELTRVLLLHDHSITWWIPDGQLCPTVPNRSNYIHWIEDLLSSDIIPNYHGDNNIIKGFDIGTGANCIYPLLGASLLGWSFVGSDVTDVALEWAEKNVKNNPQISKLIEIRKVDIEEELTNQNTNDGGSYTGPPILLGVVKNNEKFDFCICNPPFFETMDEAGLNPNTSCGGTPAEMVCPGGEQAFISRMIQDSVQLKQSFRWYTSMVGKKSNLKSLISKLREVGVTVVKTTEFVQGQTSRWGIAWSFIPPTKKIISSHVASKNVLTFMLEGIQRQFSAFHVLQSVESFFKGSGASCKLNAALFYIDVISNDLHFRVTVFEQIPGTLLVRGSLKPGETIVPGLLSSAFLQLEDALRKEFCPEKVSTHISNSNRQ
ncbi:putative 23S rRNA (adenine(1618)-N(6))-methyltransferase [Helianthus annuus]|nr:putative 23S rRNA (adenine(1618)-N(6))-methyltransferase [Helianthus annuus]